MQTMQDSSYFAPHQIGYSIDQKMERINPEV